MSAPSLPAARDATPNPQQWARLVLTLALVPLAWKAFHDEYGVVPLLSDIDLAIHEFGHMLFMPFGIPVLGQTMVILGGSLTQIAFPLLFVAYFLRRQDDGRRRDPHAAMVCLWWASINVLGVAIYAADARAGQLMLLTGQTGQESDAHDWYNLFARWGMLNRDTIIAGRMRVVAVVLCTVSIVAGAYAALSKPAPAPAEVEA
jgi:hypothetical protein